MGKIEEKEWGESRGGRMEPNDGTERTEGMGMLGTHFALIDDVEHACLVCCENANTIVISALGNRRAQPWAGRGWSGELCIVRLGRHSKSASTTIATTYASDTPCGPCQVGKDINAPSRTF
jgi:hypothetical protein